MQTPISRPTWLRTHSSARGRRIVLGAAALGCALLAYGGWYPRFDSGTLAPLLGALAAAAALVVVSQALRATRRRTAVLVTFPLAGALGLVVPLVPAVVLTMSSHDLGSAVMMALMLGGPVGLVYGIPLALLVAYAHPLLREDTVTTQYRIHRLAGVWIAVAGALALVPAVQLDAPSTNRFVEEPLLHLTMLAPIVCALALSGACLVAALAHRRLHQAQRWAARVMAGNEPGLRVRQRRAEEPLHGLPCIADGAYVVEREPGAEGDAYRDNARAVPVCFL